MNPGMETKYCSVMHSLKLFRGTQYFVYLKTFGEFNSAPRFKSFVSQYSIISEKIFEEWNCEKIIYHKVLCENLKL